MLCSDLWMVFLVKYVVFHFTNVVFFKLSSVMFEIHDSLFQIFSKFQINVAINCEECPATLGRDVLQDERVRLREH